MEKTIIRFLVFALLLAAPYTRADSEQISPEHKAVSQDGHREWRYARNLLKYNRANMKRIQGNLTKARELYMDVIQNGGSIYSYEGLLKLYEQTHDYHAIAGLALPLEKHFSESPDVMHIFAQALRKIGRTDEGNKRLVELARKFNTHQEIVLSSVEAFMQMREPENAASAIATLINESGKSANRPMLLFLQAQIYAHMRNYTKALEALEEALEKNPRFTRASLMRVLVLEQQKKLLVEQAGEEPELIEPSPRIERELSRHLLDLAHDKLLALFMCPVDEELTRKQSNLVMRLLETNQTEQALSHINTALKKDSRDPKLRLLKIQVLLGANNDEEAINTLEEWIRHDQHTEMWYRALHLAVRAGAPQDLAIRALERIQKEHPGNLLANIYLANFFLSEGSHAQAAKVLNQARQCHPDHTLEQKILYQLCRLHHDENAPHKLTPLISRAETINVSFAPLANFLAYYHATHTGKLKRAEQLIAAARKNDEINEHYRDTQAVILYHRKKYRDAEQLLQNITEAVPDDATMLIHLAQVHKKRNKTEEFGLAARKALEHASTPWEKATAQSLVKQIRHKKVARSR